MIKGIRIIWTKGMVWDVQVSSLNCSNSSAAPTVEFKVEAQAQAEHAIKSLRFPCGCSSTLVLCEHTARARRSVKWRRGRDELYVRFDH